MRDGEEPFACMKTAPPAPVEVFVSSTQFLRSTDASATLRQNVALAKRLLRAALKSAAAVTSCECQRALQHAIVTAPEKIPPQLRRKLALLTRRILPSAKGKR